MVRLRVKRYLAASAVALTYLGASMSACAQGLLVQQPPYRIVLRSRGSEAVPDHNRPGQTGGGYIEVVLRGPDAVAVNMRGAVVAGSETHCPGRASLQFVLNQDFDIVATRPGLRPPVLELAGEVIGTLQSSSPVGGAAEQAPACAAVNSAGQQIVGFCVKPHVVGSCQKLFVNDQVGPQEVTIAPGCYSLHQTFALSSSAPEPAHHPFPRVAPAAAANFDPEAKLDGPWIYVLHDFRQVPRRDFGFSVQLRVFEAPAAGTAGEKPMPAPRPGE